MTLEELVKDVRFSSGKELYDTDSTTYFFGYIECKNGSGISYTIRKIYNKYSICAYAGGLYDSDECLNQTLTECIDYNKGIDVKKSLIHNSCFASSDVRSRVLEF